MQQSHDSRRQKKSQQGLKTSDQSLGAKHAPRPMKMAAPAHTASELPLEELLALYGYEVSNREPCPLTASLPDMTLDKVTHTPGQHTWTPQVNTPGHPRTTHMDTPQDQITKDLFPGEEEEEEESSADDLTPSVTSNTSDLFRRLPGGDKDTRVSSSDEDSDDGSIPTDDGCKDIMVGAMYQAKIPPLSPYTFQERAYDNEDQLLWSPGPLPVQTVEKFLLSAQTPGGQKGAAQSPTPGETVRDNEQALYELVKCNFNAEEALRRLRFNGRVFSEELCAWSEEESRNFEHGYRVYGKDFHLIQANKVRTRSVGECVEYYYIWKKSNRHEYFTQQASRLTRRKYNLQFGNMEDGEQDGEGGEPEGSSNSQGLSHGSLGPRQLVFLSPPHPGLGLEKPEREGRPRRRRTSRFLLKP